MSPKPPVVLLHRLICRLFLAGLDPDWDFFLPDDEEAFPEPGDFWVEPPDEE